jgi:hypothetical protein
LRCAIDARQLDPHGGGKRAGAHELCGGGGRKVAIAVEPRHPFAHACAHALEPRGARANIQKRAAG